ncbi:hypothetical protein BRADI_1g55853v3, partial [Brachypodium distachyon]
SHGLPYSCHISSWPARSISSHPFAAPAALPPSPAPACAPAWNLRCRCSLGGPGRTFPLPLRAPSTAPSFRPPSSSLTAAPSTPSGACATPSPPNRPSTRRAAIPLRWPRAPSASVCPVPSPLPPPSPPRGQPHPGGRPRRRRRPCRLCQARPCRQRPRPLTARGRR